MKYIGTILLAISLTVVKSDHHSGEAGNKPPARPPPPPPPARPAQAPKPQQAPPRPAQPRPQASPKPNQEPSKVASAQGGWQRVSWWACDCHFEPIAHVYVNTYQI